MEKRAMEEGGEDFLILSALSKSRVRTNMNIMYVNNFPWFGFHSDSHTQGERETSSLTLTGVRANWSMNWTSQPPLIHRDDDDKSLDCIQDS